MRTICDTLRRRKPQRPKYTPEKKKTKTKTATSVKEK
jgi:hypothetical protein